MFESGLKPWQTPGWKPSGISTHGKVGAEQVAEKHDSIEKSETTMSA